MTIKTYDTRDEWRADRPNHIGASESPAILGHGYSNQSATQIYVQKTDPTLDDVIDETMSERMEIGLLQEPVIKRLFEQRTGLDVETTDKPTVYIDDRRPYLSATLDGELCDEDGKAVWEAKNVDHFMGAEWEDGCPLRVQIQTQHQMMVTGYRRAYIAALIGGNRLVWRRYERNDKFIAAMLPTLSHFWNCVQARTPPPVDASVATGQALARLYREDDGETVLLPDEAVEWDEKLLAVKTEIKGLENIKRGLENEIKAAMGSAAYGQIPGGGRYSWKTSTRHEKAREAREVTIRTLRRLKK